jgi:hypothetical protein
MAEETNTPSEQPKKNIVLYVVIGIAVICFVCCGIAMVLQLILENSDFTLVNIIRPIL